MLDSLTIVIYCHHVYQKHFHYGNILQESYIIHNVISVFAKKEITITIAHTQGFWNSAETFDSSSKLYYYSKKIYIYLYILMTFEKLVILTTCISQNWFCHSYLCMNKNPCFVFMSWLNCGHSTYCVLPSFQVSHSPKAEVCVSGIFPICAHKASHPCDEKTQGQGSNKHFFYLSVAFKAVKYKDHILFPLC